MFHLSENCTCVQVKEIPFFYLEYQKDVHEKGNCPPLNRCELDGSSYREESIYCTWAKVWFVCLFAPG